MRRGSGRLGWALACLVCSTALTALAPAGAVAVLSAHDSAQVGNIAALDRQVLNDFMGHVPGSPRSYSRGIWYSPGADCFWCLDTAGTAAAVLSRETKPADRSLLAVAKDTLNVEISRNQQRDGSWDGSGIVTGFVAAEVATSYLELRDVLDRSTRARWVLSVRRAADFLVRSKTSPGTRMGT